MHQTNKIILSLFTTLGKTFPTNNFNIRHTWARLLNTLLSTMISLTIMLFKQFDDIILTHITIIVRSNIDLTTLIASSLAFLASPHSIFTAGFSHGRCACVLVVAAHVFNLRFLIIRCWLSICLFNLQAIKRVTVYTLHVFIHTSNITCGQIKTFRSNIIYNFFIFKIYMWMGAG